jgi:hypothetical protein
MVKRFTASTRNSRRERSPMLKYLNSEASARQ